MRAVPLLQALGCCIQRAIAPDGYGWSDQLKVPCSAAGSLVESLGVDIDEEPIVCADVKQSLLRGRGPVPVDNTGVRQPVRYGLCNPVTECTLAPTAARHWMAGVRDALRTRP